MSDKVGPLLTDLQLVQWRHEVGDAYAEAERLQARAVRKGRRLKRYIHRHFDAKNEEKENG